MSIPEHRAVPTRAVAVFLALSFGIAWIGSLPLLLGGGGQVGGASQLLTAAAAMTAPAVGVLVAGLAIERMPFRQLMQTTGVVPRRPFGPLLRYGIAGVAVIVAAQVLGLVLGTALGRFEPDLTGLSGLHTALGIPQGAPVLGAAAGLALFYLVAGIPFVVFEEWGWRGYLEPRLQPWGIVPMMLVSGLIWGLWHLPAAFSVGRDPAAWLGVYLVGSVLVGSVLCWTRDAHRVDLAGGGRALRHQQLPRSARAAVVGRRRGRLHPGARRSPVQFARDHDVGVHGHRGAGAGPLGAARRPARGGDQPVGQAATGGCSGVSTRSTSAVSQCSTISVMRPSRTCMTNR